MQFYFLAGERSGDQHAAHLLAALRRRDPATTARAWGGDALEAAGATLVHHYRAFSVMGFAEILGALPKFRRLLQEVTADLRTHRPDVVVLVDFGGFNLRVARIAKKLGIRVYYYITPKLWAWGAGRAKTIARTVDRLFLILPFEPAFFAERGITRADYVGNPVADDVAAHRPDPQFRHRHQLPLDVPLIAVLPGSRRQELEESLHVMLSVVNAVPDHHFVVAGVSNLDQGYYAHFEGRAPNLSFVFDDAYNILANSRAALVTSGTATLETALFGVPQVVCYATGLVTYQIVRLLIRVPFISLVNLIAGRKIVPELIQNDFTGRSILEVLPALLADDSPARQVQLAGYAELQAKIGQPGAPEQTARLMLDYLRTEAT